MRALMGGAENFPYCHREVGCMAAIERTNERAVESVFFIFYLWISTPKAYQKLYMRKGYSTPKAK